MGDGDLPGSQKPGSQIAGSQIAGSQMPGGEGVRPASRGLAAAALEDFSVMDAVGGVRGLVESVVPVTVFTLVFALRRDLNASVAASVGVAIALLLVRLVTRRPVGPAVSGLFGVAIGAGLALWTGHAINFFLNSIGKNAALGLVYLISMAVRWPLVGVMLGSVLGEGAHWRQVPERARVYQWATLLWAGMFAVRLAVQVPLYLQGRTKALGAAAVPLGLPLYGLVLLLTWLIVRRVPVARPQRGEAPDEVESGEVEFGEVGESAPRGAEQLL
jgi:hypothetical protein